MYFNQSKAKFGLIKDIKGQIFLNYKYKCNSSVKGSFLKKMGMLISFECQPHLLCKKGKIWLYDGPKNCVPYCMLGLIFIFFMSCDVQKPSGFSICHWSYFWFKNDRFALKIVFKST